MPWRVSYELHVEGVIEGTVHDLVRGGAVQACINAFRHRFPPGGPGAAAAWSGPFVLPGYQPCGWTSDGVAEAPNTALLFHAEVKRAFPLNQGPAANDLQWFYGYRGQQWYNDLTVAMQQVENAAQQQGLNVIRPLGVRAWRWYCGNGGW